MIFIEKRIMKNSVFYLSLISLFTMVSCVSFGKIHTVNDDFKNEHKTYVKFEHSAVPLEKKFFTPNKKFDTKWEKITHANDDKKYAMTVYTQAYENQTLTSDFYIKTDSKSYKIRFNTIKNNRREGYDTNENIRRENDSLTVITKENTVYYYDDVKAKAVLDKALINAIKNSENIQIRIYLDEDAYTIRLSKAKINTLKKAFDKE